MIFLPYNKFVIFCGVDDFMESFSIAYNFVYTISIWIRLGGISMRYGIVWYFNGKIVFSIDIEAKAKILGGTAFDQICITSYWKK